LPGLLAPGLQSLIVRKASAQFGAPATLEPERLLGNQSNSHFERLVDID
jgi:hypothetical protein